MSRYYLGHGPLVPDDWGFGPAEPPEPDEPDECPDCLPHSMCLACADCERFHAELDARMEQDR